MFVLLCEQKSYVFHLSRKKQIFLQEIDLIEAIVRHRNMFGSCHCSREFINGFRMLFRHQKINLQAIYYLHDIESLQF